MFTVCETSDVRALYGNITLAVAVTAETDVTIAPAGDDRRCTLQDRGIVVDLLLRESRPGSNSWAVVQVALSSTPDGASLSAATMRDFPYARCFARAAEAVRTSATPHSARMARPGDPPASFIEDRRGSAPRTDKDYALLAASYVAAGSTPKERADVARAWASRYPGSVATWRNRIAKAKKYVDGAWLTEEGARLVYGEDISERIALDAQIEQAEVLAHMEPWDQTWRRLELNGYKPASLRLKARAKLGLPNNQEQTR